MYFKQIDRPTVIVDFLGDTTSVTKLTFTSLINHRHRLAPPRPLSNLLFNSPNDSTSFAYLKAAKRLCYHELNIKGVFRVCIFIGLFKFALFTLVWETDIYLCSLHLVSHQSNCIEIIVWYDQQVYFTKNYKWEMLVCPLACLRDGKQTQNIAKKRNHRSCTYVRCCAIVFEILLLVDG